MMNEGKPENQVEEEKVETPENQVEEEKVETPTEEPIENIETTIEEPAGPEGDVPVERIFALQEGEQVFESNGISRVKVTRQGLVKALEIPIKSSGVADLMDKFADLAPKPPVTNEIIDPKSEVAKQLGITRKRHIKTFDFTDKEYMKMKQKHDRDLGMAILMQGLDIPIKNKEGMVVTEPAEAVEILRGMGMSTAQFIQITNDIQSLTDWNEQRMDDFFEQD